MMEFEEEHEEEEEEEEEEEDSEMAITPTFKKQQQPQPIARYKECLKNHAVNIGGHAVDGCCEFLPAGVDGTLEALRCAACNCHRNFHRKELIIDSSNNNNSSNFTLFTPRPHHHHHHNNINNQVYQFYPYNRTSAGYLHVSGVQQRPLPLALPSPTTCGPNMEGGVGSGGTGNVSVSDGGGTMMLSSSSGKKRFRTKFSSEQKDKMLVLAERLGWKIQKQDEDVVQQFCSETGVKRHVLKVWMHNNKHTLGKKP